MSLPDALLLDTCAVIWLATGTLKPRTVDSLDHAASARGVFVSPVSAWEIGFLSRPDRGQRRLQLPADPKTWLIEIASRRGVRVAPLTLTAALDSASLPEPLHNDPGDRLLIATAREMGVPLVTRDQKLLDYAAAGHVQAIAC